MMNTNETILEAIKILAFRLNIEEDSEAANDLMQEIMKTNFFDSWIKKNDYLPSRVTEEHHHHNYYYNLQPSYNLKPSSAPIKWSPDITFVKKSPVYEESVNPYEKITETNWADDFQGLFEELKEEKPAVKYTRSSVDNEGVNIASGGITEDHDYLQSLAKTKDNEVSVIVSGRLVNIE